MPRVRSPADLCCGVCNACIAPKGLITCMRCKQSVDVASIPASGIWSCPKCQEHGKDPKTLAKDGAIRCKFCDHENPILELNNKERRMGGETLTLTSLYRDNILLALRGLELRKQRGLDRYYSEKECIELNNTLAVLDMGFDLDRFEEILPGRLSGIPGTLPPHGEFDYFLPTGRQQGIKYVGFYLRPKTKTFSVLARTPVDEATVFSLIDVVLENISYGDCILYSKHNKIVPEVIVAGNMLGIAVRVRINSHQLIIRCGDNLHEHNTRKNDKIRYFVELEPSDERESYRKPDGGV